MHKQYVIIHAHCYQPPREDPYTEVIEPEVGAEPYHDFNEKINAECYRPNALAGNFESVSFNIGPTLAWWLEEVDPPTYERIIQADQHNRQLYGCGNAMAQPYNHPILPALREHDQRVQVAWGIADFRDRFGHEPEGMWLPETAVSSTSLGILAEHGIKFTLLAPWQIGSEVNSSLPLRIALPNHQSIAVFPYNAALSTSVSFIEDHTNNATVFTQALLSHELAAIQARGENPALALVASDGEVYGHHKPWRDQFLAHLLNVDAPKHGIQVTYPARFLREFGAQRDTTIVENTAWSCAHDIDRWVTGCGCTEGPQEWKAIFHDAIWNLAARIDDIYTDWMSGLFHDPWAALCDYLDVRNEAVQPDIYFSTHARTHLSAGQQRTAYRLLRAQYYKESAFTSCGLFFEHLDRLEPKHNLAAMGRAIGLIREASGIDLDAEFIRELRGCTSWRTGATAADLYRRSMPTPDDEVIAAS